MNRLNKILVICSDTENYAALVDQLGALLGKTGAEVTLMKPVGEVPEAPIMNMAPGDLADLVNTYHRHNLEAATTALSAEGLKAAAKVVTGNALHQIVREASTGGYDLVVKSAERRHDSCRPSLRGLDLRLLRMCPLPVLLLR